MYSVIKVSSQPKPEKPMGVYLLRKWTGHSRDTDLKFMPINLCFLNASKIKFTTKSTAEHNAI